MLPVRAPALSRTGLSGARPRPSAAAPPRCGRRPAPPRSAVRSGRLMRRSHNHHQQSDDNLGYRFRQLGLKGCQAMAYYRRRPSQSVVWLRTVVDGVGIEAPEHHVLDLLHVALPDGVEDGRHVLQEQQQQPSTAGGQPWHRAASRSQRTLLQQWMAMPACLITTHLFLLPPQRLGDLALQLGHLGTAS